MAAPTLYPTPVPTARPTPVPTASLSNLQVAGGAASTTTLDNGMDLDVRLANATSNATLNVTARSMTAADLAQFSYAYLGPSPCRLPAGVHPIAGFTIDTDDVLAEPLVVGVGLDRIITYEAEGRHLLSCAVGTDWRPPAAQCEALGIATDQGPTSAGLLHLTTPLCETARVLVVDLDTRNRWCAPGRYGCDCAATRATRTDTAGEAYMTGFVFLGTGHLLVLLWYHPLTQAYAHFFVGPFTVTALVLLVAAAATDDPDRGDPTGPLGGLRSATVRTLAVTLGSVTLTIVLGVAVALYRAQKAVAGLVRVPDTETPPAREPVPPSPPSTALETAVRLRPALAYAYVALASQLSIALAITNQRSAAAWSAPLLVVVPNLAALALMPSETRAARSAVAICAVAVAVGSFLAAAFTGQRACGQRYGADQPFAFVF